jgi:23S rRNA (guanosine2251-2'-O)-methyltransferase
MNDNHIIFGLHSVEALMHRHPERIIQLCFLEDRQDKKIQALVDLAAIKKLKVQLVSRQTLDKKTHSANHQGVIALCEPLKHFSEKDLYHLLDALQTPAFLLILDGIQDPHNLGACLRSADAAGVHAVIAPKDRSVGLTPTVSKVASGAAESVPFIQVTNLARTLRDLKERNIWIYGADGDAAQTLYNTDLSGSIAIALGAEGAGLRRLTREHCDVLLQIPMIGSVSSLNVSVATGVFLFEAVRQRGGGS